MVPAPLNVCARANDEHCQLSVRFDDQCVLIPKHPHRHRIPRMVTKSYSLPLWKRRSSSSGGSASPETDAFVPEDSHIVLRVPIPSFSSKAQSPTPTRHSDPKPLSPCLVQRSPSSSFAFPQAASGSPQSPRRPTRTASLSPSRSDIITVPLRPCCAACEAVTEASLSQGDTWTEHFSRSARRRRSCSPDEGPRTITVEGSIAAASFGLGRGVPISVDEVDKRRRSSDSAVTTAVWLNGEENTTLGEMSAVRMDGPLMVDTQRSSSPLRLPNFAVPSTPRIPEEEDGEDDEDQLFPLPSPRRSPGTSPAPSPSASASCIGLGRPSGSPVPSNSSSVSLGTKMTKDQFLAPPVSRSSSSLSLAKTTESDELSPRAPSPHVLATAPSISARPYTRSSSLQTSYAPSHSTPAWTEGLGAGADRELPPLPSSASTPVSIPFHMPGGSRSHRVTRSLVPSSPSTSPNLSTSHNKRRHGSLSLARPRHIIADVLRGVGVVGGGAVGIGVRV
ncbi:uncharacterized protein EDB91DRAFT_1131486 [Suillus paluster]|uniref:uncharacterized protein n=1 Tax=Suillus paluster TaxID=48578 RepID=UPI001B860E9B|nr:uncharacterized protein EDB91DRAFT_1131486 [Suillus paluster]KAG1740793.1 hypothetical protein EDB91DRAFT_1131486 [Suillus paluster]